MEVDKDGFFKEERTMEKEKIEVRTYKFKNGETIDEILSKQTSWATDEECLDNMIENSLREVADFANEKENELLKKISIEKNNPEVDLKLLAVQTDAAARYMAEKHYDDILADAGKRPFSKYLINIFAQDDFPYEFPSWMKNHLEEYPYQNVPEHTSEEERTMEKEKIEVQTYKFKNGETIDEILSKQTSWATDEECLDNMIDNSLREVADFANEKENELLKKISIEKNNPEVDLKLLAVQTDVATRYMAEKHYDDRLADVGKRPFSKIVVNMYNQDVFPYELPSWMKNYLEEYPDQNEPEHTSEEEKAYQEWEEMLDDNQKAEEIIERNQRKEPANVDVKTNYVIDKLSKAGIEVVTDKEEFDRILESHSILQKMTADLSEFDKLATKLEEEKKVTENIEKQKKSLEEKKEEIARTNYNELVDFINKTGKFIPAQDFDGFGYYGEINNKIPLHEYKDSYERICEWCVAKQKGCYVNSNWDSNAERLVLVAEGNPGTDIVDINDFNEIKHKAFHVYEKLQDSSLLNTYKDNLKIFLEQKITREQQNQHRLINEVVDIKTDLLKTSLKNEDIETDFARLDNSLRFNSNFEIESVKLGESVSVFPGSTGKSGLGIRHLIEERTKKDHLTKDEITALSVLVLDSVRNGEITRESDYQAEFTKNGIVAIVRKDFFGNRENWILTGFAYDESELEKNREATEAIKTVIANYSNSDGYSYFRNQVGAVIASLDTNITYTPDKSSIQSLIHDNTTYGFAHNGKIYLNPDVMNSEAAVHEYTHLWDAYTQKTNPELWEKGLNIFKGTHYWEEVKSDPNYADISNDDNLVLSEIHSRICGKMAEKILEKIIEQDGQLTKDSVINWDKETWEYMKNELWFNVKDQFNPEDLKQFLSTPMKDLFQRELNLKLNQLKENIKSNFNTELTEYIEGKLPKNHIFNLGFPGEILQNCGFPKEQRIELSGSHLEFKSKLKRHQFDLREIKGLDIALQNPIAVFTYGDRTKSQNVIVNIVKDGKKFLTGIHFNQQKNGFEISSIRTIYPKENIEWLNWINQGKMIYGNKEKLQALIAQQRMNVADVNSQVVQSPLHEHCLESARNILQKFGDVKEIYTDGHIFYEELREKSKIEQKFFAYYTEKGNLDARELSTVEADEFYTALKNNDIAKIDEYKKNDLHEISELANEIFLDYTKNNPKNELNYHGLTLAKKDNNLIEPAYDVLLIKGIDDKTDSKLVEMLDNSAKWDQYCISNNSENFIPAIAAQIVSEKKEVQNESINKSFIEKVQELKEKVTKSLKKNVAVGIALTSIFSANPNLFAQTKTVVPASEQKIIKEAEKEKEELLKTYKNKSPEELLNLILAANEAKTAAKIEASREQDKNQVLEKENKELKVKNEKLDFYKEHYKTKSAVQESFYEEKKKTQDMYEVLKRSSQEDHDILYKHAKIVVNGKERVCHTGLVNGFKNCVERLDNAVKLNNELVKENIELRNILNRSNQNERNGVSY